MPRVSRKKGVLREEREEIFGGRMRLEYRHWGRGRDKSVTLMIVGRGPNDGYIVIRLNRSNWYGD